MARRTTADCRGHGEARTWLTLRTVVRKRVPVGTALLNPVTKRGQGWLVFKMSTNLKNRSVCKGVPVGTRLLNPVLCGAQGWLPKCQPTKKANGSLCTIYSRKVQTGHFVLSAHVKSSVQNEHLI